MVFKHIHLQTLVKCLLFHFQTHEGCIQTDIFNIEFVYKHNLLIIKFKK